MIAHEPRRRSRVWLMAVALVVFAVGEALAFAHSDAAGPVTALVALVLYCGMLAAFLSFPRGRR